MIGIVTVRQSVLWMPQWWVGALLVAICWPLNWGLPGLRTAYLFFPLWLGYVLVVDGLVLSRTGSSLWTRSHRDFALLFVASSPVWWLFEAINQRTDNWRYLGSSAFSGLEYFVLCTICFSTVMPAVFETAELARTFRWVERFACGPRVRPAPRVTRGLFVAGAVMLTLTLAWPRYFYPFVWSSLVLLLEPLNCWLGRRHLLRELQHGDWRPVVSLAAGALISGFFWEMWNYYSFPKWVYFTPGAQFLHVFEMPLLGYGGYIPFALELYSLKNFLWPGSPRLQL
jgi:hypothetical protein